MKITTSNVECKVLKAMAKMNLGNQEPCKIKAGRWYICMEDGINYMDDSFFSKGLIYLSPRDGCLIPYNENLIPCEVHSPENFRELTIQDIWRRKQSEEKSVVLRDTFGYEEGRQRGREEGLMLVLNNPQMYGLEKQGKKGTNGNEREIPNSEPADKVKLKFKIGDWVFIKGAKGCKYGPFQIKTADFFGYSFDEYYTIPFMYEDLLSKWTVQDAKDGDVLYCESDGIEYIVMSKGVNEFGNIDSYFRFNSVDGFAIDIPSVLSAEKDGITPATKEQRDFLFKKLKEAGYEWDAEKKELRKIEQSPAWSKDDERMLEITIGLIEVLDRGTKGAYTTKDYTNFLKSLKDRYTWKPSKEQIIALRWILNNIPYCTYKEEISGLLDQIKDFIKED